MYDEMALDAGINVGAEAMATLNAQDFPPAGAVFNLRVLTPAKTLSAMGRD